MAKSVKNCTIEPCEDEECCVCHVDNDDIAELKNEAALAGDEDQVELCRLALGGSQSARQECERVIRDNRLETIVSELYTSN